MTTAAAPASSQSPVPAVGDLAPDFTLSSTSGDAVTLSALRGHNVLLAFFPLAFTSTCTAELCAMTDDYDQFAGQDVTVLPISVDATPSLKAFQEKYALKNDLLSDFRRDASRAYGVLNEERFFSNRAYFLIDRDGIVRWAHVEEMNGNRRDDAEILAEIAKLG
jgi:peroxiredoxin